MLSLWCRRWGRSSRVLNQVMGGGGHPISKAYWGRIWGGDTERDVLVHVFECRVIPSPPR